MKRFGVGLAIALAMPAAVSAQMPVVHTFAWDDGDAPAAGRWALRGGEAPFADDGGGLNAFFYPDGYDPQYGSDGRVADAAGFAADYGCRPIWNAKYGRTMPACN